MKIWTKIAILCCALGWQANAFADEPPAPGDAAPKIVNPALWVVKDKDTTIYLFGTIHVLKPGMNWFQGPVKTAFDASRTLVLEMVEPPLAQAQKQFMQVGVDHSGKTLHAKMTAEQRIIYDGAMTKMGMPINAFDIYDPWASAITLDNIATIKTGFSVKNGVEPNLANAAKAAHKRIMGVETFAEQLNVLDSIPPASQMDFLIDTAKEIDTANNSMDQLVALWAKPDPAGLAKLMNDGLNNPDILNALLIKRNAHWAKWIAARMKKPGTLFFAVGAGHLSGDKSVPAMLKSYGIEAQRVQ